LLPELALPARVERGCVLPAFLDARDLPWLGVLMDEIDRFRGLPVRMLEQRLREPLPCVAPYFKARAATRVLRGLWKPVLDAEVAPATARETLFLEEAASSGEPRPAVVARAAAKLNLPPEALEKALFADLPGEKIIAAPPSIPSPNDVALRTNQLIAKSLLYRATRVRIRAEGSIRPVVRQAKLKGLICTVEDGAPPTLELSGPYSLFRRTLLYGRALGELLPFLGWCARFELEAQCVLRGEQGKLRLRSGDPLFPAEAPRAFDSELERRFARDLKKAAPDWDLVREPEPVRAGGTIIFPDFLLRHRIDTSRRFLIELIGFWTPEYLARKLNLLRAADVSGLILCLNEDRRCAEGDLPEDARIVWYRRRIDVAAVLATVGG
jgi:uncharacterized protein